MTAGRPVDAVDWPDPPAGSRVVGDPAELAHHYGDRRSVHVYALADLEEPFWSGSRWYRRGDGVVGLVGLPDGEGLACYAVATRDVPATLDLLVTLAPSLPGGLLVTGPVGTAVALRAVRAIAWDAPHMRYELTDPDRLPEPDPRVEPVRCVDDLTALYRSDPDAAFFVPHMFDDGAFVGSYLDGDLIAAAGTHVLTETYSAAAIGAVYTRPAHRGHGLGRAVTSAVARHLLARVRTIGLNVAADNASARHVYERLGFVAILPYEEAELA